MAGKKAGLLTWGALALVGVAVYSCVASNPPETSEVSLTTAAKGACRYMAPKLMNDPSSVEFDPSDQWIVAPMPGDVFMVTLGLRAKNGLNALVHGIYTCRLHHTDGKMVLLDFTEMK